MSGPAQAAAAAPDDAALSEFTEYFVKNYPGPRTVICDPNWHAPRIFRAAKHALASVPAAQVSDMRYQVEFTFQTGYRPVGLPADPITQAVACTRRGQLDFIPQKGMFLDVGDGFHRQVKWVFWSAKQPAHLVVVFKDCYLLHSYEHLCVQGWNVA